MKQLRLTTQITNRDSPLLEKYFQEIAKTELLTSEEEVALAKRIKKGDAAALEMLTKANLRFVVSVAKQYQNQGLPLSDLINEGNLGLIKAAQKFDESKGFKFISYAVWWIRQSILQSLVEQARIIRLPVNKMVSVNKIKNVMNDFEQEFQREPTDEELEEILQITKSEIHDLMASVGKHVSFDAPAFENDEDSGSLKDRVPCNDISETEQNMSRDSLKNEIKSAMSILSERDAQIVCIYYGLDGGPGHTLEEIGKIYGLTRERVRQIKEKAIRRLKKATKSKALRQYLG
ncbi:MAG: RNA polymerase sigma factor RpoD/SigA [Chitinophagaceae bacterium]|nr:MAG: RNA polymerase sigma factor RpoD/SigA [Chitinophagaceae bacterium]